MRFGYIEATDDAKIRMDAVRNAAEIFERAVIHCCPPSREKSLAMTKLEECVMWANKSIAVNQEEEK